MLAAGRPYSWHFLRLKQFVPGNTIAAVRYVVSHPLPSLAQLTAAPLAKNKKEPTAQHSTVLHSTASTAQPARCSTSSTYSTAQNSYAVLRSAVACQHSAHTIHVLHHRRSQMPTSAPFSKDWAIVGRPHQQSIKPLWVPRLHTQSSRRHNQAPKCTGEL